MLLLLLRGAASLALTASPLAAPQAVLGTSALTQSHALTPAALSAPQSSVGSAALSQVHALTATALEAPAAALSSPTMAQGLGVAASSLAAPAAALASATLVQAHALTATAITAPASVASASLTVAGDTERLPDWPVGSLELTAAPLATTETLASAETGARLRDGDAGATQTLPRSDAGTEVWL